MGKNTTDKRIKPLGQAIEENHGILSGLLSLLGADAFAGDFDEVFYKNPVRKKKEMSLDPSRRHLEGILDLLQKDPAFCDLFRRSVEKSSVCDHVWEMRLQLTLPDSPAFAECRKILKSDRPLKKWTVLEAPSHPDLYIEGDDFIFLAEGRRKEISLTEDVSYLLSRNAMVRHLENAISLHPDKKVIACYILDEDSQDKKECSKEAILKDMEAESVPLCSIMKERIASSFFGYVTWSQLEELGVSFDD